MREPTEDWVGQEYKSGHLCCSNRLRHDSGNQPGGRGTMEGYGGGLNIPMIYVWPDGPHKCSVLCHPLQNL